MSDQLHRWLPLYKTSKSGKISTWYIIVRGNKIITSSGFVLHKQQEHIDVIKKGKNLGKKNETTPHEQAVKEAASKWQKKVDNGYVTDKERAERGETDDLASYAPMLAHTYDKHYDKIIYPCFVQPKLDGLRATYCDGFYSRMRKPFPGIKHISGEIEYACSKSEPLDGELYSHEFKDDFETIVSMVKAGQTQHDDILKLKYHVYDINYPGPFGIRHAYLLTLPPMKNVVIVPTYIVESEEEMMWYYHEFMDQGYEGIILRNMHGHYETRRSYNLQKYKEFIDSEFPIVGIEEGRGKLAGHVGNFICEYDGHKFGAKLKGSTKFLKECFIDHSLWKDKWLSVKYQGFTNKLGVPRFPVGLKIRDVE